MITFCFLQSNVTFSDVIQEWLTILQMLDD